MVRSKVPFGGDRRGQAFRIRSAVPDIPINARKPPEGSGTAVTLALSA